jgi:uncharacterized protein (TIGR03086 family)
MGTEALAQAFAMTREILDNVKSDQYDDPTPCVSWNVRAVVNHVVEGANWFALCVNGGAAPDPDPTHGVDYAAGDVMASYDTGVRDSLAAFGAPGAQERIIKLPFGDMPGAMFMGIAMNDVFVHGWDLAKATGQATDLNPQMATQLLEQLRAFLPENLRGPDGQAPFGPETLAPEGAAPADRLAAFLGRQV